MREIIFAAPSINIANSDGAWAVSAAQAGCNRVTECTLWVVSGHSYASGVSLS